MNRSKIIEAMAKKLSEVHSKNQLKCVENDEVLYDDVLILTDWSSLVDYPIGYGQSMHAIVEIIDLKYLNVSFRFEQKGAFINQY